MKLIEVELRYTQPLLGSTPANKELYSKFIATKMDTPMDDDQLAEETAAVTESDAPGVTVFPRDKDGKHFRWDYQVRGFFKEACSHLRKVKGTKSSAVKAYKKLIDGNIFVAPRQIPIHFDGGETTFLQRPLRASTPQGERIALTSSEMIPAGATEQFTVTCFNDSDVDLVAEWLEFGKYHGSGQWRNSGIGAFEVTKFHVKTGAPLSPSFAITED